MPWRCMVPVFMQILAAFDKFKDAMSASRACEAVRLGALQALGESVQLQAAPLTDGGEGFCPILTAAAGGRLERHTVRGPRGEAVDAPLGWVALQQLPDRARRCFANQTGQLAILEMASVAGLEQVPPAQRHPKNCSTHGVGELLRIATRQGATAILLGIGGSATSDLGLGALEALGLELTPGGCSTPAQWPEVHSIQGSIQGDYPPIFIACDVDNPLLGEQGAAYVYGPQKGLPQAERAAFDAEAGRLATLLCDFFQQPHTLKDQAGSGAAGGLGFGLKVALGANYVAGFELVRAWLDLDTLVQEADLVLTGEGKFDRSSLSGKGPYALAAAAHAAGKPCIVLAGKVEAEAAQQLQANFPKCHAYSITPEGCPLPQALAAAAANLQSTTTHALLTHDR